MASKFILHMITPLKHMSPFDVNMALDAGFDAVLPYTNVDAKEVTGLVQDAMFSRPPQDAVRTGIFIGGKDAILALDMLESAKKAYSSRSSSRFSPIRQAHSRRRQRWSRASRSCLDRSGSAT